MINKTATKLMSTFFLFFFFVFFSMGGTAETANNAKVP